MSKDRAIAVLAEWLGAEKARLFTLTQIHRKRVSPELHPVYLAAKGSDAFAVKLDLRSDGPEQLRQDYAWLMRLRAHMRVVPPCYLSNDGHGLITGFCDAPTLRETTRDMTDLEELHRALGQAGNWLTRFHRLEPQEIKPFWPGWMVEKCKDQLEKFPKSGHQLDVAHQVIDRLWSDAGPIKGRDTAYGMIHGDLNGMNLLHDADGIIGLDFQTARSGAQIIDIAHLLRNLEIDLGTQRRALKLPLADMVESFALGYRDGIDRDILQFALNVEALVVWLRMTPERTRSSWKIRKRQRLLEQRLQEYIATTVPKP